MLQYSNVAKKFQASQLEPWQEDASRRLLDLWQRRPADQRLSQAEFAARYDIGTQGNLWQYLPAKRPLNLETAIKFATGLGVQLADISPQFAGVKIASGPEPQAPSPAPQRSSRAAVAAVTIPHKDKALLEAYNSLPKDTRLAVRMLIETLAGSMNGDLHKFMSTIEDFNRRRDAKEAKVK